MVLDLTEKNLAPIESARPTLLRSKTEESFASEDSIRAKQRQKGKEGAPVDVSLHYAFLDTTTSNV